jgi:hypothetical protein
VANGKWLVHIVELVSAVHFDRDVVFIQLSVEVLIECLEKGLQLDLLASRNSVAEDELLGFLALDVGFQHHFLVDQA